MSHPVDTLISIQFAGAVGVSNCAGGPRIRFLTGRSNISQPSPNLLVPEPDNTTDELIERFTDAGLDTVTMVNLLISHTVAAQDKVDPVCHVTLAYLLHLS